ncbi:exopolysaccharide biosynthesis polyprenyl glycosylphosphotransferase [Salinarimonas chemoclinalis]|uniref:exopolysaccharide biosynthesis polyprenyl glycosylphosphotransferase n=1 Tax=Salinarimonas chemoclinalis TaxID=3241599 RepID=UPI00355750FA
MTTVNEQGVLSPYPKRLRRAPATAGVLAAETLVIVLASFLAGIAWHLAAYGRIGPLDLFARDGASVAILFLLVSSRAPGYPLSILREEAPGPALAASWAVAFSAHLGIGFLAKSLDEVSRGSTLLFLPLGFVALAWLRTVLARTFGNQDFGGRVLVVGSPAQIARFGADDRAQRYSCVSLPLADADRCDTPAGRRRLDERIASGVAMVRTFDCDRVLILVPWEERAAMDACIEAFLDTPATIHVATPPGFETFARAARYDAEPLPNLRVAGAPAGPVVHATKRVIDVVLSGLALFLLAPLLVAIAVAIRLDSPGPALFAQTRHGFNQKSFRILKFRTMTALEDGPTIVQATRDDPRVTRLGRLLRRYNLDELPQLVNVLRGEMSLVGPRPHAVAHDLEYQRQIARYARRHNVKPGITGWAQVHGLRGRTETVASMERRVAFDLYYIENHSILLDLRILLMTLSPRAFLNAY